LQVERTNALVWASRYVRGAPELATEAELHDEARELAGSAEVTLDALRHRVGVLVDRLPTSLREVASGVQTYLVGARNDQERFLYADPPKSFDRIEEMLPPVLGLLQVVGVGAGVDPPSALDRAGGERGAPARGRVQLQRGVHHQLLLQGAR
jgi:hypothetical protein